MRKRTIAKWVAAGVCVMLTLCLTVKIIINYPIYPAFIKEINSFYDLQKVLKNDTGAFLPDITAEKFNSWEYELKLDGRSILSEPNGYECYGSLIYDGVEVRYSLNCDASLSLPSDRYTEYRGGGMYYYVDEVHGGIREVTANMDFRIGNYCYEICAVYPSQLLSDHGIDSLNREIKLQMLQFAKGIIDGYFSQN